MRGMALRWKAILRIPYNLCVFEFENER